MVAAQAQHHAVSSQSIIHHAAPAHKQLHIAPHSGIAYASAPAHIAIGAPTIKHYAPAPTLIKYAAQPAPALIKYAPAHHAILKTHEPDVSTPYKCIMMINILNG